MQQKYYFILALIVIAGIIFISGCTQQIPQEIPKDGLIISNLGEPFQLKINQTAFIQNENLKIKLLNVTEDSRCHSDSVCVWEGQATTIINFMKNNKNLGDFILISRAGHGDLAVKNFDGYSIKLIEINPYPKTNQRIELSDYTVTLAVSKIK